LTTALEKYPKDAELIANSIVLNVLAGKPSDELESYVLPAVVSIMMLVPILTGISLLQASTEGTAIACSTG
jgi:coatomer protein complex subunit epsilon